MLEPNYVNDYSSFISQAQTDFATSSLIFGDTFEGTAELADYRGSAATPLWAALLN
jgi:hypothetical protein